MGEICRRLQNAERVKRFYIECEDCGEIVLDSARANIPAGQPEHTEAMADTAIRGHADQTKDIIVGDMSEKTNCESFDVTIETAGKPLIDPTTDPNLNVDVTIND